MNRLPGIYFSHQPSRLDDALPRMDIAAFVGFASSGPLHTPVPVESVGQFRDIFGEDVALPALRGGASFLGASVEAFFSNGGLRCWVVRVAAGSAKTHCFTIDNLSEVLLADEYVKLMPTQVNARSEGSWAWQWRVKAISRFQPVHFANFGLCDNGERKSWCLSVRATPGAWQAGELLRFTPQSGQAWYGFVDRIKTEATGTFLYGNYGLVKEVNSPPLNQPSWLKLEVGLLITSPTTDMLEVQRVRCDLVASHTSGQVAKIEDLALSSRHPRFWGRLPSDVTLFAQPQGTLPLPPSVELQQIRAQAQQPRFPLAGCAEFQQEGKPTQPEQIFLPTPAPAMVLTSPPELMEDFDGLQQLDERLFLHSDELDSVRVDALIAELEYRYYIKQKPLKGIYSLLPIQEVSLLSVPDLVHLQPGTTSVTTPPFANAPLLKTVLAAGGDWLVWEADTGIYRLEQAGEEAFTHATTIYQGTEKQFRLADGPICQQPECFRVAQLQQDGTEGLWSNTVRVVRLPLFNRFCGSQPSLNDVLPSIASTAPGQPSIQGGAESAEVKAEDDTVPAILAVQRAMLRFCAARQDMLAILSLPDYGGEPALRHVNILLSAEWEGEIHGGVLPLSFGESWAFDYAAVFHPWLAVTNRNSATGDASRGVARLIPCDGAICGSMARMALRSGAWVAPANTPLADVVALFPTIDRAAWQRLANAGVNLVRQDGRGFLLMNADTLSFSHENRPLNVRRLLILLRRLVLREGNRYVFEPDSVDFRNRVYHQFNQLLANLYSRGAFAGSTQDAAFRVVMDRSVNTPHSLDMGRFIVELRVAPAHPMQFITVRLLQSDRSELAFLEGQG